MSIHSNIGHSKISPIAWAFENIGVTHCPDEDTRRYWRKAKRNRGQKAKSLRTHRRGILVRHCYSGTWVQP